MSDILDTLRSLAALEGFSDEHLSILAGLALPARYQPGELIFREGQLAEDIYFLVRGQVSLEICTPGVGCRRILTLGDGELLGWSPVLEHARFTATGRALTETTVLRLRGTKLLELCERDPRFGYEFMRRAALALAKRLTATRLQLVNVYGQEMRSVGSPESGSPSPQEEPAS